MSVGRQQKTKNNNDIITHMEVHEKPQVNNNQYTMVYF